MAMMISSQPWEDSIPSLAKDLSRSIRENGYGQIPNFLPNASIMEIIDYLKGVKKYTGLSNFSLKENQTNGT